MGAHEARTLAIDIGGSGLKMLVLDADGNTITERTREKTPGKSTPEAVLEILIEMLKQHEPFERISVGFPGVVNDGITEKPANLHASWQDFDLATTLTERTGRPTRVANDADVQGLGAIQSDGVELVITLGTGFGSALFLEGRLVPNLELGHHPFRKGASYEETLGASALKDVGKQRWNKRLQRALRELEGTFNYRHLYIGGGNRKHIDFKPAPNVHLVENVAGLLGGIELWNPSRSWQKNS